jgi:hypothetical protein
MVNDLGRLQHEEIDHATFRADSDRFGHRRIDDSQCDVFHHRDRGWTAGVFAWDVSRPHTIFINPIAGIAAIAVGIALAIAPGRQAAV